MQAATVQTVCKVVKLLIERDNLVQRCRFQNRAKRKNKFKKTELKQTRAI